MGPLQDSDHMVQKPPYWDANCPLGHLKQRKFRLTSFVLDVPVRNLRPIMADLYHVITILQRAHCGLDIRRASSLYTVAVKDRAGIGSKV